jgi:trans-aconitate methyltransferase
VAEGPAFYDAAIADEEGPHLLELDESPYRELFETVVAMINARAASHVIDLGCGAGRFAQLLLTHRAARWLSYRGYDFSQGMVDEARNYTAGIRGDITIENCDLRRLDAVDYTWMGPLTIVCLETLEHLDNDIRLLARLPLEARLIVSVPSFDSAAHVRHFPNIGDALDRYQDVMEIDTWKPVWLPERTGYFHLLTGRVRP